MMSKKNFEKSIELLNKAVADELLAIHQYMYFHFHCDDQGYDLLASLFKKNAIMEMGHVEILSERILFLKGDVEMKILGEVKKIRDPKEMLKCAAEMEDESAKEYNIWANECSANADSASKKIFEDLVLDEEAHFDQFDTEMGNMERFGENYFALQAIERSKVVSTTTKQN
jgi:bacterioferritin